MLSQGIDIKNLNTIVLFATPQGRQFIQRIGRVLRKDAGHRKKIAIIIILIDENQLNNKIKDSSDYMRYLKLKEITYEKFKVDKDIIAIIKEKVNEANESDKVSDILIEWINEIDQGKKDLPTNKIIDNLLDNIK